MIHWDLKTRNNQSEQETQQYLCIFLPLIHQMSNCPEHVHNRHCRGLEVKNVLGYYRNLGSLRYGTSTASCKDAYGKMHFFSWTEVLFNHAVKLHDYWLCRCRKTNQWVGSGAARTYGDDTRQYSRRNGRGIWLYKRSFRHRILRFTSTEATTESCSYLARQSTQYSFRISGNRGYDSNRVRSLSILHSYCVL